MRNVRRDGQIWVRIFPEESPTTKIDCVLYRHVTTFNKY
jgi:ribosomal protein L16/L10AE